MPRPELEAPLAACSRGELAPNLALMRLVMAAQCEDEVEQALDDAVERTPGEMGERIAAARALWNTTPALFQTVKAVLRIAGRSDATVADWATAFDEAAELSKEASVALYSLGRQDLLDAATREIVGRLRHWGLLGSHRRVLEIGCGIGRLLPFLAQEAELVVGLDISPVMLRAARERCAGLTNVTLVRGSGESLAVFDDDSFDLVLAIDVFPYLVACGGELPARHVSGAARILKRGGSLVVMNYSYRGDDGLDRREVAQLARNNGLSVRQDGRRDLRLWDGLAFHLAKPP
jgi:ubiquinone/menaquinone biosynthesis C-methylase UbiE